MKQSDFSQQFPTVWASGAESTYVQYPIPGTTTTAGRASLALGFPPETFTPPESGGVYPFGSDENGIFRMLSKSAQNYESGVVPAWSSGFSTSIGGYPQGAVTQYGGQLWQSTADDNTTTPGASGASWKSLFAGCLPSQCTLGQSKQIYYTPTPSSSQTTTHNSSLTFTAPCDGVVMASANFNVSNIQPSQCQATLTLNGATLWSDTTLFPMSGSGVASVTKGTAVTINSSYSLPPAPSNFAAVGQTVSYLFVPVAQP